MTSAFPQGANLSTQGFGNRPEDVEVPLVLASAPPSTLYRSEATAGLLPLGKRAIVPSTNSEYVLTSISISNNTPSATWTPSAGGGISLSTLTGDSGVATPVAGNINILGTSGEISTVGSGDDITISIPDDFLIGSSGGASAGAIVAGTGGLTFTTGNGIISIASGTAALNISTDVNATAVNVATGAAAKTLTLGSTNTTSSTTIQSGSGGLAFSTGNGAITINSGTGTIGVSTDAAATTVNLGTGAGAKTVTLGSSNTTSTTAIVSGSGGLSLNTNNGALAIASGIGTLTISNDAAATTVAIATGAGVKTVTLGSDNTTSSTTLQAGSGGVNCTTSFALSNVATFFSMNGGAVTDFIGQATLANGTVTVANTNIAAGDRIFVSRSAKNGSTAYGVFETVITPATNFVITACKPADTTTETGDTSIVDYIIFRQT